MLVITLINFTTIKSEAVSQLKGHFDTAIFHAGFPWMLVLISTVPSVSKNLATRLPQRPTCIMGSCQAQSPARCLLLPSKQSLTKQGNLPKKGNPTAATIEKRQPTIPPLRARVGVLVKN